MAVGAWQTRNGQTDARTMWVPPPDSSLDIFDEIPRDDPTYQRMANTLIPHPRLPGLCLLQYFTFHNSSAYQPCCQNLHLTGFFDSLWPLEQNGDPLFRTARYWSCHMQSMPDLPRDVRWVLSIIYNFANEMLRPENDEDTLWKMRSWLLFWYEIANRLFEEHEIPASSPEEDWFLRPTVVTAEEGTAMAPA
ncbi:hypothetical protein BGZ63DRAFT_421598 [Mariannaea sp. PMI_226]|nr:hypothetical protein BGZ63DRAFT_421598 [Mariannaea sp. PMI_226]